MTEGLSIRLEPTPADGGPPEQVACVGEFLMTIQGRSLTSGIDDYIMDYRAGPIVSGYYAAEWFAWNWWRLRYEPRSRTPDWWRAHRMTAIGEGYAWPNITIFSDGVRTTLLSEPSARPDAKPFRYLGAYPTIIPSVQFEAAIDAFIGGMEDRLHQHGLSDTNLSRVWAELQAERANPADAARRRLEALLARDPDEADESDLDALDTDAQRLGRQAVEELAAEQGRGGVRIGSADLERMIASAGIAGQRGDAIDLPPQSILSSWGEVEAWVIGAQAAAAIRDDANLGDGPLDNTRLSGLAGVSLAALTGQTSAPIAFTLDSPDGGSATVLRSRNPAGRRFELARLIGDLIVRPTGEALHAATRVYTYRQKMQRSFAAELLCPFDALDAYLDGDITPEAQQDAADYFRVSELTVRTLLVNHKRLEREELDLDLVA